MTRQEINATNISETKGYEQTLTVVPTHETAWEVWDKYRKNEIAAEVYPELSVCKNKKCLKDDCWRYKYKEGGACVKGMCRYYEGVQNALTDPLKNSESWDANYLL